MPSIGALLVGALGVGAAVGCGRPQSREVVALLPEAPGVHRGGAVEYHGIRVGEVKDIGIEGGRVRLRLQLTRPDVPLRATDRVRVRAVGIMGEGVVEIVPATTDSPLLPVRRGEADTLGAAPSVPADTQLVRMGRTILDSLNAVLRRRVR